MSETLAGVERTIETFNPSPHKIVAWRLIGNLVTGSSTLRPCIFASLTKKSREERNLGPPRSRLGQALAPLRVASRLQRRTAQKLVNNANRQLHTSSFPSSAIGSLGVFYGQVCNLAAPVSFNIPFFGEFELTTSIPKLRTYPLFRVR